jgi:hypothetical protein
MACGDFSGTKHFLISLPIWPCPHLADILPFHHMAAYELTRSFINFIVLYELKTHIVRLIQIESEVMAAW